MGYRNPLQVRNARLERLAHSIEGLAEKDERRRSELLEMRGVRRRAATEIHAICAELVASLNRLLERAEVTLDPSAFPEEALREGDPNLIQINIRGRILQIEFTAPAEMVATDEFRIPYTLKGSVRAFNQTMLDKDVIEEQLLFYTLEKEKKLWRFFDARTYRSGPFDQEYLVGLIEQLL